MRLVSSSKAALQAGAKLMKVAGRLVADEGAGAKRKIGARDLSDVAAALGVFQKLGSKGLQADLSATLKDMKGLEGRSLKEAFEHLSGKATPGKAKAKG